MSEKAENKTVKQTRVQKFDLFSFNYVLQTCFSFGFRDDKDPSLCVSLDRSYTYLSKKQDDMCIESSY